MAKQLVYGATEAVAYHKGTRVVVHKDEPWDADDPIVKARPDLFGLDPEKVQSTTKKTGSTRTRRQ